MSMPVVPPPRCGFCSAMVRPPGQVCAHCRTVQIAHVVQVRKSPAAAVLLSLLWLGAGQLYLGQIGLGVALVLFDAFLLFLSFTGVGLIISVPIWLVAVPTVMIMAGVWPRR